ncbi:MAG: class I SAM-dependent methyltransferase [Ardenticatenaceae bacterium]|nr:class I SAM-dependent methyltransferase [Anaerolineales bacterium]MCB8923105.1 class I SAM-dependent methyltransferase [Ardenticatenaceae bacterium]MCB8990028.1 class I SAM-dependent methyltransferase [Ardenticatenaceae bacterium]
MNFAHFFRYVQDAPWYAHFLMPVLEALRPLPPNAHVLDVGTGAGKLIELGQAAYPGLRWTGADVDEVMLAEARQRLSLHRVPLHHLQEDGRLPFEDGAFDVVTFCSVLFLLPDPEPLLQEARRVLRPEGRLITLTPTGNGRLTFTVLRQIGWHPHNWTFFLWRTMTAGNGRAWAQKNTLPTFAQQTRAAYSQQHGFQGLAVIEVIDWVAKSSLQTSRAYA